MVVGLKRADWSIRQIAAETQMDLLSTAALRRWLERENVESLRGAGTDSVTSPNVNQRIYRQAVLNPQAIAASIREYVQGILDVLISTRAISCRLVANDLH